MTKVKFRNIFCTMNRRVEGEPGTEDPKRLIGAFKILRIIEEPTQEAVDAAVADQLRVLNLEGFHTQDDAVANLIVDNPKGSMLIAVEAAQEYDRIHGSSVTPVVKQRIIARNPDIVFSRRFLLHD